MNGTGYVFERRLLNRDLFYLLCIFGGSKRLAEIAKVSEFDMACNLKLAYQSHEIQRLLVSIAVHLRIMYEQYTPSIDEEDDGLWNYDLRLELEPVGELWRDGTKPLESEPLLFRAACNKIIHATKVDLSEEKIQPDLWRKFLLPEVTLHGTHRQIPWKARVQIEQFADRAYSFTSIDPLEGL